VWVLTHYLHDSIKMFEFNSMEEARKEFDKIIGCKILSEVIYYTDFEEQDVMQERELSFAL